MNRYPIRNLLSMVLVIFHAVMPGARAQSDGELARQLVNPFTDVVRLPLELGFDKRIGPARAGNAYSLNAQPLIPITLDRDWTLISRTILPVVEQTEVFPGAGRQFGLGDTLQSFFLSPRRLTEGGLAWGAGVAVLVPTARDDLLGGKKWGLGPTGGVFKDIGPWSLGLLANHIWSVAGSSNAERISSTFVQPALSYSVGDAWQVTLQSESNYAWRGRQWSVPVEANVAKLVKIGDRQINLEAGVHYWAISPAEGAKGWGWSFTVTWLFAK
jgi:hypothetical protein